MKRSKLRKKTKNEAEVMRKRCVSKAKEINKITAGRLCDYCKIPGRMVHSHHIFSEGLNRSMSSDTNNLVCVCWLHHLGGLKFVKSSTFSFHGTPTEAIEWFKAKYPARYKELKQRAKQTIQADLYYWQNKYKELQIEYQKLCQTKQEQQAKKLAVIPFLSG